MARKRATLVPAGDAQATAELKPAPQPDVFAIIGSRTFPKVGYAAYLLRTLPKNCEVLTRGSAGPETVVRNAAQKYGVTLTENRPDWTGVGQMAGVKTNMEILGRAPKKVIVLNDGGDKGVDNLLRMARDERNPQFHSIEIVEITPDQVPNQAA